VDRNADDRTELARELAALRAAIEAMETDGAPASHREERPAARQASEVSP
jgi:hypothetical protein